MEREEIVEKISDFLREFYYNEILLAVAEGRTSVNIDFTLLEKFDTELADFLLDNLEKVFSCVDDALKQIDVQDVKIRLRFFNLPESRNIRIRNIRSEHIGKLLVVDGIVKRASEIRPEVGEALFECPECGERIQVVQTERIIRAPIRCSNPECKNTRGFRVIEQKLYDARWVVVEEPFEVTTGERPSELMIYLKEDLTSPKMQSKTDPGNRIKVVGVLKELPRRIKGTPSRQMEIYLDANFVESIEVTWEELEITEEDEKKIIELAKDPEVYSKLIASIAPTLYGMDIIKEALVLQLFGGVQHILKDGSRIRGNIHILLIGDPASGKSLIMQVVSRLMPRGKYVSGTGTTAVGLTASVIREEEFFGGWVLEAGAVVMSNKSICAIDEFTKISPVDRVALQEAMSLETISIAKANIVATLPAQTAILAGANPKLGRFDPYIPVREQVDIDDVLLSRFDLKFALRDVPNPEIDSKMAEHILKVRHFEEDLAKPVIPQDLLRKFIAYARTHVNPKLTKEASEVLMNFYLEMRSKAGEEAPVSITLRQYEALIRLAEASARIQLRNEVNVEDALRAINLMKVSLRQFGFEPETGKIDVDRAEGYITAAQRGKIRIILDLIEELETKLGKNIPEEELIKAAKARGIDNVEDILRKMLEEGILFTPGPNLVQRV
ncbi:MAG: minichromosome maintenance protein MCM [Candidatus Aenigmatarchaeota archaeon]